jgi:ribonuclease-3
MARLESLLGYRFRRQQLLQEALVHPSYVNENPAQVTDNQRLEFLGDAVLDLVFAEELFRRFPDAQEGQLTRWRAQIVCTEALAAVAMQLRLGEALVMGRGEEASGGRQKPSNLAAALEALVAALYLDSGLEAVRSTMLPLFEDRLAAVTAHRGPTDPRTQLQELTQGRLGITPVYRLVAERGPDHARTFVVQVLVDGEVWGEGEGHSKQAAAHAAARQALQRFGGLRASE